jgi:hypothetical protein
MQVEMLLPQGCLASAYLAAWVITRSEGLEAATSALRYVAPVGEKEPYVPMYLRTSPRIFRDKPTHEVTAPARSIDVF